MHRPFFYLSSTDIVTRTSNDLGTRKGGASDGDAEKAGWKADSEQTVCRKQEKSYKPKKKSVNLLVKGFS